MRLKIRRRVMMGRALVVGLLGAGLLAISATAYGVVVCPEERFEVWDLELVNVIVDGEEVEEFSEYDGLGFSLHEAASGVLKFEIIRQDRQEEVMRFSIDELPETLRSHVERLDEEGGQQ